MTEPSELRLFRAVNKGQHWIVREPTIVAIELSGERSDTSQGCEQSLNPIVRSPWRDVQLGLLVKIDCRSVLVLTVPLGEEHVPVECVVTRLLTITPDH